MSAAQAPRSPILLALEESAGLCSKRPRGRADKGADAFCAEGQLPIDALTVSVKDIGALASPLRPEGAYALHAASTPAHHGRRDKTLLDKRVRDTGELHGDLLTLHWGVGTCEALQAAVASALGLQRIEARLHNLLVYGPGQFFKPHQDTEKHRGMVGTLVLVWPSPHIGGELVVRHGSEQAHFASQHLNAGAIRWCAFYADCRHEVAPVSEGWRVVLTFDLVLPAQNATPRAPVPAALSQALREHFLPASGPRLWPWVFLLDHEYTERGLHWPLLKGADRPRVATLRAAAEALGLTIHLALAEVHEQWTAAVSGGGRWRGRGDRDDRDDPEPDELIDRGIVLNHWVDADDRPLRRAKLPVAESDTASFSDTDESFLVNQEYEGYMGNYGETLDYWYRRAALVIQTPTAEEAGRFVSDFDAALADAVALARQGRGDELATRLHAATRALDAQRQQRGRALFAAYCKLAAALPDADQARGIMQGFDWVELQSADARALARLSARRGEAWTADLIDAWTQATDHWRRPDWHVDDSSGAHGGGARPPWPRLLQSFLEAGFGAGLSHALIDRLLSRCHQALVAADASLEQLTPARRGASLAARLQALCDLAAALRLSSDVSGAMVPMVRHVQAHPLVYPPRQLRPLVQALPADGPAAMLALRDAVLAALRQALATPERPAQDHTVDDIEWVCRCADCNAVIGWAESAHAQALTLAMPEARRRHVQERLSAAAAPLVCTTLRQGSPHKLVIAKASGLHNGRQALRRKWEADLAAIDSGVRP